MPDAWANINATAFSPVDCDPICWTCDIRATVRAAKDEYRARACSVARGLQICGAFYLRRARNSTCSAAVLASPDNASYCCRWFRMKKI